MAAATEVIALAESNDTPSWRRRRLGHGPLRGGDRRPPGRERAAALLRDVPEPERWAIGPMGLAYLALNQGRIDDALGHYDTVRPMSPVGVGLVRWEPEWIEALVRAGRRSEAMAAIAEFEAMIPSDQWVVYGLGRPKGMLAEADGSRPSTSRRASPRHPRRATVPARGARRSSGVSVWPLRRRGEARVTSSGRSSCCAASAPPCSPSGQRPSCARPVAWSARTSRRTSC